MNGISQKVKIPTSYGPTVTIIIFLITQTIFVTWYVGRMLSAIEKNQIAITINANSLAAQLKSTANHVNLKGHPILVDDLEEVERNSEKLSKHFRAHEKSLRRLEEEIHILRAIYMQNKNKNKNE